MCFPHRYDGAARSRAAFPRPNDLLRRLSIGDTETVMGARTLSADTVGMSESIGVAVLLVLTITVTGVVGLNVLVLSEEEDTGPTANFSYDYVESSEILLITHEKGDEFEAGNLEIEGPTSTATWAELAGRDADELVGPGDIAQIGEDNAYGSSIGSRDTIRVYYNESGNRTQLSEWNGATSGL